MSPPQTAAPCTLLSSQIMCVAQLEATNRGNAQQAKRTHTPGFWPTCWVPPSTAVLPQIPHSNSCKRVLKRPLRPPRLVSIPLILRINLSYLREKKDSFFLAVHVLVPSGALEQSDGYSRSRKNLARQLSHSSYKSALTGSQRPICESGATVGVRGFSENGCKTGTLRSPVSKKKQNGRQEGSFLRCLIWASIDPQRIKWSPQGNRHYCSQDAVSRLFWAATETATSHWLFGLNACIHWSVPKSSACPHIARQTRLLSSESQRGAGQPHQWGLEGGGGVPCRDLYIGESAPIRPFFHGEELMKDECWLFEGSEWRTRTGSLTALATKPQDLSQSGCSTSSPLQLPWTHRAKQRHLVTGSALADDPRTWRRSEPPQQAPYLPT